MVEILDMEVVDMAVEVMMETIGMVIKVGDMITEGSLKMRELQQKNFLIIPEGKLDLEVEEGLFHRQKREEHHMMEVEQVEEQALILVEVSSITWLMEMSSKLVKTVKKMMTIQIWSQRMKDTKIWILVWLK
jgi:hypothetical protein